MIKMIDWKHAIWSGMGRPVVGTYGKWHRYLIPKRLTLESNPAIFKWLFWNFTWDNRCINEE